MEYAPIMSDLAQLVDPNAPVPEFPWAADGSSPMAEPEQHLAVSTGRVGEFAAHETESHLGDFGAVPNGVRIVWRNGISCPRLVQTLIASTDR